MLHIQNLSFSYAETLVVQDIHFTLPRGNHLAIMGESGCGKSTLLKLIYGLMDFEHGSIHWNDKQVLGPKFHLIPGMPYMKYLAQDFDLMPYITVAENVGKFLSNFYPEQKKARIEELLRVVEMEDFYQVKAKHLSGGQMQRVALARVLAREPELLLLDEPFSHIDNFRKNSLRRKIFAYLKEKQITCIVASHDCTDVLSYTDELLVMRQGKMLHFGNTQTIYNQPGDFYTASLFGEVNQINLSKLNDGNSEFDLLLLYPYQLKVVYHSELCVTITKSYFKGSHFLIEAVHEVLGTLFFESPESFVSGTKVFLAKKTP
jgi:ABC-type sulfate/molybdate transport systems ATPase subunit